MSKTRSKKNQDDEQTDSEDSSTSSSSSFSSTYSESCDELECSDEECVAKRLKQQPAKVAVVPPMPELPEQYSILQKKIAHLNLLVTQANDYREINEIYKSIVVLQKTELFSKPEMQLLISMYEQKRRDLSKNVQQLIPLLNECKELWETKQRWLIKLHEDKMISENLQKPFLDNLEAARLSIVALEGRIKL